MSQIIVVQGNEFGIYSYKIRPKDIFITPYLQAAEIVEEIVVASARDDKRVKRKKLYELT